jgi:hypothetical protein
MCSTALIQNKHYKSKRISRCHCELYVISWYVELHRDYYLVFTFEVTFHICVLFSFEAYFRLLLR